MDTEPIRQRSGQVSSSDPLVIFLYVLLRDHVTPGHIEELMKTNLNHNGEVCQFSNGWLATYAMDIASRLKKPVVSKDIVQ